MCEIENELGKYYGQIRNGVLHGKGKMCYKNGDKYDGNWKDAKYHGMGSYFYINGNNFYGNWYEGLRNGHGKDCKDGNQYLFEGDYSNDKRHGFGILKHWIPK